MSIHAILPDFNKIQLPQVESQLKSLLQHNLKTIDALLNQQHTYTWENLLHPIETLNDRLTQFWGSIQHLSAVMNSDEIRAVVHACLPQLSDYHTHIAHNEKLFRAIESIKNSSQFSQLTPAQQKSIEHELRDFKLNGVNLSADKKKRFAELSKSLSQLMHRFEENLLDATMAFQKHITDEALLSGIPIHAKNAAKNAAKAKQLDGWLFTLEAPDYLAVMKYADSVQLRFDMYQAYMTRASDVGPDAGKFDNTQCMQEILQHRVALASLLGFDNYAQYSLATKMVKKTDDVLTFLNELAEKSQPAAQKEFNALSEFSQSELGMEKLNAWDVAYASEKLRLKSYDLSPEDLRPYFPEHEIMKGLFDIMQRLYGITLEKVDTSVWHRDVSCYRLLDEKNQLIAHLYFDLYARENKRGGAWMDECRARRLLDDGSIQLPAAYVTCNFNAPIGHDPALFTHEDVVTLFHECGHALQHVLTKMDVANVSGIQGIPWDAVEVASQFFEHWAWEKSSVSYFAKHYQTGATLPSDLFERMQRAKNFQSAMQMIRQLEFSLFDFRLHMEYDANKNNTIQAILNDVRTKITVVPVSEFNRFQHGFSHIFGGSYGAGYYSYKWAEVMACDAFSLFKEKGIFDKATSKKFQTTFLESGGAIEPLDLFIQFRGRKPEVDALLVQAGIGK